MDTNARGIMAICVRTVWVYWYVDICNPGYIKYVVRYNYLNITYVRIT